MTAVYFLSYYLSNVCLPMGSLLYINKLISKEKLETTTINWISRNTCHRENEIINASTVKTAQFHSTESCQIKQY